MYSSQENQCNVKARKIFVKLNEDACKISKEKSETEDDSDNMFVSAPNLSYKMKVWYYKKWRRRWWGEKKEVQRNEKIVKKKVIILHWFNIKSTTLLNRILE